MQMYMHIFLNFFSARHPAREANISHSGVRNAPPSGVPSPRQVAAYAYEGKRAFFLSQSVVHRSILRSVTEQGSQYM